MEGEELSGVEGENFDRCIFATFGEEIEEEDGVSAKDTDPGDLVVSNSAGVGIEFSFDGLYVGCETGTTGGNFDNGNRVGAVLGNDVEDFKEGFLDGQEDIFGVGTPVVSFDGLYVGFFENGRTDGNFDDGDRVRALLGNDVEGFKEGFLDGPEDIFGDGTLVVRIDGLYVGFFKTGGRVNVGDDDGTNEQNVGAVAGLFTPNTIIVVDGNAVGSK